MHFCSVIVAVVLRDVFVYSFESRILHLIMMLNVSFLHSIIQKADITRVVVFTATCFSNVAVMGSLDVRLSVCDVDGC